MMKPTDKFEKLKREELLEVVYDQQAELDYLKRDRINRLAKNSVFVNLFSRIKYALRIYKELHPEDADITADEIEIITVRNVMAIHKYNDLGLLVRGKLIVLVEAQSEWSPNIIFRIPGYYFDEMDRYVDIHHLDIHSRTKVSIPEVEAYVIYSGKRRVDIDTISLREEFFSDREGSPDFTAKVIYSNYRDGIIGEFLGYCKVWDEQREVYPDDPERRIQETIRICLEKGYLVEFLTENRAEVEQIMLTAYEPRKVREAQERSMKILAAISAYKDVDVDDDKICQLISNKYGITTDYARNYIQTYEEDEADRKAGLVNA